MSRNISKSFIRGEIFIKDPPLSTKWALIIRKIYKIRNNSNLSRFLPVIFTYSEILLHVMLIYYQQKVIMDGCKLGSTRTQKLKAKYIHDDVPYRQDMIKIMKKIRNYFEWIRSLHAQSITSTCLFH